MNSVALNAAPYSALFLPEKGMNFISLKKGEVEAIDQSTRPLFDERCAGLGAMIGPHFHHRTKGGDPYSHGVGRYASWTVEETTENRIRATLRGDDELNGIPLKEIEGQDFTLYYTATLTSEGLQIELAVRSETESVVGLHTYYALNGSGTVTARVQDHYNDQGTLKPIPSTWNYAPDHTLTYPLTEPSDYGFHPYPDRLHGVMELATEGHGVRVAYWCDNEENSIQMWHPEGASFVCMEPLSAKDPRKPRLTVSQLKILISIL